ncbi:DUF7446 family protein [Candidatus Sodalis pierantonius]|uniref:DUF7446 family protein n=1 Tax=Candidatus Sodalis pierantonii TaxID=1486991 RepID=UPI00046D91E6|nr:hypothetical protein [Candidatus Sodalis pierantonius]
MKKKISVGYSTLSGRILAGHSTQEANTTRFTGKKYDVTDEAITAVTRKMLHREESIDVNFGDGLIFRLQINLCEDAFVSR